MTVVMQRARAASSGDLLDIVALDRAGVLVTSQGVLVRVVDVTPVDPRVMGEHEQDRVSRTFGRMCGRLRPGQTLQFYVEGSPIRLDDVTATMRTETGEAIQRQPPERAEALLSLAGARERSITDHAAQQAAVSLRTHVVIPYLPLKAPARVDWEGLRNAMLPGRRLPRGPLTRGLDEHYQAISELNVHVAGIVGDLDGLEMGTHVLDGVEVADLLRRRFNPSSVGRVRMPTLEIVGSLDEVGDAEMAATVAHKLREQVARSPIDLSDSRVIGVEEDLERILTVTSTLEETEFGWLLEAMQIDRPFVLSVFVHATDKMRERTRLRRQRKRVHGLVEGTRDAGKVVDEDMEDQRDELSDVRRELKGQGAALFDVSVYMAVREPSERETGRSVKDQRVALIRASERARDALVGASEAAVGFGAFDQKERWRSTLPIGQDVSFRTRRYISRNVGDTVPLIGPKVGSPQGVPMFFTTGLRTLERLNPWDRSHTNGLMLVTGQQGSGKTMWLITTGMALLTYGAHVVIVDRSGHWEFATRLVPGAAHLSLGAKGAEAAICPFDVPDLRRVDDEKVRFLVGLHEVNLGQITDVDKNLLGEAILGMYARCAREGRQPLERELKAELELMADMAVEAASGKASKRVEALGDLALRLTRFVAPGPDAFLMDRPTTIPRDAPLVVYDTRPAGEHLAASMLIAMEHTLAAVERRGQERVARGATSGWCLGDFLGFDETWAFVEDPRAGAVFNELTRRIRHYKALVMAALTQFLGDFDNPHGRALLNGAHQRLFFSQSVDAMKHLQSALGLSDRELEEIDGLSTAKGQGAKAYWINGKRGRGTVDLRLSGVEYWTATSEPNQDVPLRERVLAECGGDAWLAVRRLAEMEGVR